MNSDVTLQTPSEQGRRNRESDTPSNRTKRRRIYWNLGLPTFVHALEAGPYDLTRHAGDASGDRGLVFVIGHAQTKSQVQASTTGAASTYVEGRYPTVTTVNKVQVAYAAQWFGEGAYTPADCVAVWIWLQTELQQSWRDDGIRLLTTPATTGRDLWVRSIDKLGYPIMSPEAQNIARSTSGQGRMEVIRPGAPERLNGLYEYDARMAYVSLIEQLPIGEPEHHASGASALQWHEANPYNEGRFRVSWKAPRGWAHPGILAAHGTGPVAWVWPLAGEGWCSGVELFTARRAGWDVHVHEAHVWPVNAKPLRTWRDRLLRILTLSASLPGVQPVMARAAIRGLILHSIGAFHGAPHRVSETGTEPPVNAQGVRLIGPDLYAWWRFDPPKWPQMVHPEWSATIWGRARARLASGHRGRTGFMSIDPRLLVGFRTDAVYTSQPVGWQDHDDGATPGRYRERTFRFAQPQAWPVNGHDILNLREIAS